MRIIGNDPSVPRQTQEVASGTLPNGKPVVVNADGTVSVVAESTIPTSVGSDTFFTDGYLFAFAQGAYDANAQKVVIVYPTATSPYYCYAVVGTVSGTSISFGTPVALISSHAGNPGIAYDSTSQKIIISFEDAGDSNKGKAVVGTVSGTSISFGSVATFASASTTDTSVVYDSASQKAVIVYRDSGNSNYGTAIVGTVSGTSISFGSEVVFESATSYTIRATYDSAAQKVVVSYRDNGNSNYGTAVVGTVSGTSISFGTPVVFESANTGWKDITYDSDAQKIVIAYADDGNSSHGTAIVGTVSGTSISFGTPVVFKDNTVSYCGITYDTNAQRIVIGYRDNGNSSYGTGSIGTVSGTSISFGTSFVYNSDGTTSYHRLVYDANAQKVVALYSDSGEGSKGKAVVITTGYTSQNLTSENYIGIARSGAADTAGAIIDTQGAIADNLTGLTAGQSYYVQTDGTLSTTAGDPSVFAGTAVSATKLIVKG